LIDSAGAEILYADAPAKINLSLDILGRRADGYHDLRTVMASVSLYDKLTVTLAPCGAGRETFTAEAEGVEGDNLAARAARLFMAAAGMAGWSVDVRIEKQIPVRAGLGGGSSDAAAVLRTLDGWAWERAAGRKPPLPALALELGSDVPYCLRGGVCLAEGRGEILTPLPPLPECWIVLSAPPVEVSTAEAFGRFDALGQPPCIKDGNAFEAVIAFPEMAEIKRVLIRAGASRAAMSGSGPTVFGIFHDINPAKTAFDALRAIFPKTFLTTPV